MAISNVRACNVAAMLVAPKLSSIVWPPRNELRRSAYVLSAPE